MEQEAKELQEQKKTSFKDMEEFLKRLELKLPRKGRGMMGGTTNRPPYFQFGAYRHGPMTGISNRTKEHEQLCRYVNLFLRNHADPEATWTSFVISYNNPVPKHRDSHNDKQSKNYSCSFGNYKGGNLEVQTEGGQPEHVNTHHRLVSFPPNAWHEVSQWTGERITLSAYTVRASHELSEAECKQLKSRGFPVPRRKHGSLACQEAPRQAQEALVGEEREAASRQRRAKINKQIYLLHAATGHGSMRHLIDALKRRGASEEVLQAAREFKCRAFRSQALEAFCDKHSIFLDVAPAEAHWKIGSIEQAVQGLKEVLGKLHEDDNEISPEEALASAVRVFNHREQVRGFTPAQLALGRNADDTDRLVAEGHRLPPDLLVENATGEFQRDVQRRAAAEKAHSDWHARQRLLRAQHSRPRRAYDYVPGELVFFWRSQESNKHRRFLGGKHGRFLGPARVLATETRRDEAGHLRAGSTIWCIRGKQLIKCCPEQLRRASEREALIEELSTDPKVPWTFTKVAEELGGNHLQDVSQEAPDDVEWTRAQQAPPEEAHMAERWQDRVTQSAWSAEPVEAWMHDNTAVEVEFDIPETVRGRKGMCQNLEAFFVGAMKRKAVEVCEPKLTSEEREQFRAAKAVEVKNFIAAEAFKSLPAHLQPSADQAVGMRWILTWKVKEDGTRKAKARAVLLGYQDPAYEHRAATSPVMTRQTRQMFLQYAAWKKWLIQKGDVSGAFLQGREYPGKLHCVPCPEILEAMNLPPGSVTQLMKACYGLVDAPLEWYKSVDTFLKGLGLVRSWSDPCVWYWRVDGVLRGAICGHVDDFLFMGDAKDEQWNAVLKAIQEKFKWGDWEKDSFTQCGVRIKATSDGYELSQPGYAKDIKEIPLSATRRREDDKPISEWERTQLRMLLGGLSWTAQQVAPHLSAEVSLLLSETSEGTVATIKKANQLLHQAQLRHEHAMKIHAFPQHVDLAIYAWVDAASQNRVKGGSTQGIFVGIAPKSLAQGEVTEVSPLVWQSSKIDRACRSPGAAEVQAATNGDDTLYYARYQWSEMLYGEVNVRAPEDTVIKTDGYLITDSRNVYDKLNTEVLVIKGAEKRANIELLSVKDSQQSTKLEIRWVHSEAQLANGLTKAGTSREFELYYKMKGRWRIMEDPNMMSACRRKQLGLQPLQKETENPIIFSEDSDIV
ncbi:RE1 [Symbiodinium sp. KB8]|nr:RE1 [Symbiodinium sp. KB8]